MPTLEDLRKSLIKMNPQELRDHIITVREGRHMQTANKPRHKTKQAHKQKKSVTRLFTDMSETEKQALIAFLEKSNED